MREPNQSEVLLASEATDLTQVPDCDRPQKPILRSNEERKISVTENNLPLLIEPATFDIFHKNLPCSYLRVRKLAAKDWVSPALDNVYGPYLRT